MSPISNVRIIKYINELTSKVEKLSDIVTYQTKLIQELKTDNSNLINFINTEFKKNSETIQKLPLKQITKSLIKLDNNINDNTSNTIILTNNNKEDTTPYENEDNIIKFLKSKLDIELEKGTIINITKSNTEDTNIKSSDTVQSVKYFITLDNHKSMVNILKKKLLLINTNYYLNKKHPNNINNIFYKTRQLVKSKKITNTWVFNKVYISTDKKNKIVITDTTQLTYYTEVISNT